MVPVNQVILGGDPLLSSGAINYNLDNQLQMLEKYKQSLEAAKQMQQQPQIQKYLWDDLEAEISPLTQEQKDLLYSNEEFSTNYDQLQILVQSELINLIKGKLENTSAGKELLSNQLKVVRKLKGKIIDQTNREMEMFKKFREFSKVNPGTTYEEFIKMNI